MTPCALIAGTLLLGGCGDDQSRSYRVPKETNQASPATATAAPVRAEHSAAPRIAWTVPEGWRELSASQMRVGHFAIEGANGAAAQLTVIPLAGTAGGDLANLNRWRGQLGLEPVDEAGMTAASTEVAVGNDKGVLFDLVGTAQQAGESRPTRMLAAILQREGVAWFFKMTGDDALVAAQRPALIGFLGSVTFDGAPASEPSASPAAAAATAAPPAPAGPTVPTPPTPSIPAPPPAPSIPAHWQAAAPGPMQQARFVAGDEDVAEISLAVLQGDGGGMGPNVNRWRRQLGLPAASESELAESVQKLAQGDGYVADLASDDGKRRMIAAAVVAGDSVRFFKLTGSAQAVEREKSAFLGFVQ